MNNLTLTSTLLNLFNILTLPDYTKYKLNVDIYVQHNILGDLLLYLFILTIVLSLLQCQM